MRQLRMGNIGCDLNRTDLEIRVAELITVARKYSTRSELLPTCSYRPEIRPDAETIAHVRDSAMVPKRGDQLDTNADHLSTIADKDGDTEGEKRQ